MYRHLSIDLSSEESSSYGLVNKEIVRGSVEISLARFFQPEIREIKCEKCEDGTHAEQTLRILSRYVFLSEK